MTIDDFVDTLTGWQHDDTQQIVSIVRESSPEVTESIKWNNPYFDINGSFIKLYIAQSWINIYFYKGKQLTSLLFEPTDNVQMRTVKVSQENRLQLAAFKQLVSEAVRLNAP